MREVLKLLSRACDHYHKHRELAPQDMWVPHYLAIKKFMTFKFVHVFSTTDVPTSLRYWVALEKPEAGGRSRYPRYPVMPSTHHAAGTPTGGTGDGLDHLQQQEHNELFHQLANGLPLLP